MADALSTCLPHHPLPRGRHGAATGPAGIRLARRDAAIATLAARRGAVAATLAGLADLLGLAAEDRPVAVANDRATVLGTAPGRWLVVGPAGDDPEVVLAPLAPVASVVDQSGAYVLFELSGPALADLLASLVAVDLDPSVTPANAALTTTVAHLGVTLWADGAEIRRVLVGRSLALAFERTIVAVAARHGVDLA